MLQGDTLAPYLFVIVLDYALRKALRGKEDQFGFTLVKRQSRRKPDEKSVLPIWTSRTILLYSYSTLALLSDEITQARSKRNAQGWDFY